MGVANGVAMALGNGNALLGRWTDFSMRLKLSTLVVGQKRKGERNEITFFLRQGDPKWWRWINEGRSLTIPLKRVETPSSIEIREPLVGQTNGRATSRVTIELYRSQIWDPLRSDKAVAFIWSIWHKVVAVNEWRACNAPTSFSMQCVFLPP